MGAHVQHRPQSGIQVSVREGFLQGCECRLTRAVAGSDVVDFVRVMQGGDYFFDGGVLSHDQVKSARDEVNVRIDLRRFGNDGLDSRMRARDHQYDPVRRIDGQRQLLQLLGAGRVGYQGDEGNARSYFGGLVDQL